MGNNSEKEVVTKKSYLVELTEYADGTSQMRRVNDGFSAFELLGLVDLTGREIVAQIQGKIKPDKIIRQVVIEE